MKWTKEDVRVLKRLFRDNSNAEVAIMLENIAMLAYRSIALEASVKDIKKTLLDKHYQRKHGKDAYYGQDK